MRIVSKKAKGECKVFLNNTPFKIMMNELLARVHTWLSAGKESTCNAGYPGSIPGSGRSPGEGLPLQYSWAFLVTQMVKNPPAVWEPWVHPWDGKIPWRRAWQPTSVFLSGESPRTEEPIGLQAMGSWRIRHDWATKMYACIPGSAHTSLHLTLYHQPMDWKPFSITFTEEWTESERGYLCNLPVVCS